MISEGSCDIEDFICFVCYSLFSYSTKFSEHHCLFE